MESEDQVKQLFAAAIQRLTGEDIETIRERSVAEHRRRAELHHSQLMRVVSHFPFIGRGNVMRDRLVSHAEANRAIDAAIKSL